MTAGTAVVMGAMLVLVVAILLALAPYLNAALSLSSRI